MDKKIDDGDRGKNGAAKSGMDSADDLRALLSRAALSESQYREFSPAVRTNQEIRVEDLADICAPAETERESVSTGHIEPREPVRLHLASLDEQPKIEVSRVAETRTPALGHSNGDKNVAKPRPQLAESARSDRKRFDSASGSRWSVLGRALSGEMDDSPEHLVQTLANNVSLPFTFVFSISGGTGVTTILATLARCFADKGEKVLLASSGTVSLSPVYFGAANSGTGELQSFSVPGSTGRVDTVNRSGPEQLDPASPHQVGESEKTNLVSTIRNAAASSDRLLLDPGTFDAGAAETLHPAKQFGLVPLVPDLSCVFGLLRLEEALRHRETETSQPNRIFYILNKFDNSLALHRDIKASLEKLLGDRLLPITLRRSDAVAEALADGMTVIDYCPETGIAQDFVRLADWLRERAPASSRERGK